MLKRRLPDPCQSGSGLKKRGTTYDEYARTQREEIIFMIMLGELCPTKGIVISPRKIEEHYIANKNQYRRDVEIQLQMIVLSESKKRRGAEATRRLADEIHSQAGRWRFVHPDGPSLQRPLCRCRRIPP